MSKHASRKSDICLNCENPLQPTDNYCPLCGQKNNTHKIPVKHLVLEVFEDTFHFDTKLWNTLKASFTRPGKITLDYLEGKRVRYVPPVKFYVFVSFIFFLLIGKLSDHSIDSKNISTSKGKGDLTTMSISIDELKGNKKKNHSEDPNDVGMIKFDFSSKDSLIQDLKQLKNAPDSAINKLLIIQDMDTTPENRVAVRYGLAQIHEYGQAIEKANPGYNVYRKIKFSTKEQYDYFKEHIHNYSDAQVDSLLVAKGEKASWFNRQMLKKLGKFDRTNKDDVKELTHAIIKSISFTMFIMMPLTAILLLLIFYRKKYYYEHLIFSIHIHTIFFLILSLILTIQIFVSEKFAIKLWPWAFLLCLIYLLFSLKHNYKQTWSRTILKFLLMSIPYFFVSLTLTLLAVLYGILA